MTRLMMIVAALAGALWLGWSALGGASSARAATYHIDFDAGRDSNDGLAAASAWKHAPGDPNANDNPASTRLGPGDRLIFAGGVRYRGAILLHAEGSSAEPIVITSDDGEAPAIIDGSDPVAGVRPCASAAECGGVEQWRRMALISFAEPIADNAVLFSDAGALNLSQSPNPADFFYRDEPVGFIEADGTRLGEGMAEIPADLARAVAAPGDRRIALWVVPNKVVYRPITALSGTTVRFDPEGLRFYTDRPDRIAVIGHPALIDVPGEYAVLPGGRAAVALLPEGARSVTVAQGRGGIDIAGSRHVVIRDLGFENMADDGVSIRTGVAIMALRDEGGDIRIEDNVFRNFVMQMGQGPITLKHMSDVVIADNRIDTVALGSGMRLSGPASGYRIENNEIRRIGRTGIMLMRIEDALVTRNRISDVKGVHGNGVSAYMDNKNVRFIANTIIDSKQPATFNGMGDRRPTAQDIVFANNLMIASDDALGALISWGNQSTDVTILNNVLIGGGVGLRLSAKDSGLVIADNVATGMIVGGGDLPPEWRLAGNAFTELSFEQKSGPLAATASPFLARVVGQLGNGGGPPPAICAVIQKQSVDQPPEVAAVAGAIGADLRCP